MTANFQAEVFQNSYLPAGSAEVHAIMTVSTLGEAGGAVNATNAASNGSGARLFGIICDTSGSMDGAKIQAAKKAIIQLIEMLPADVNFFIIRGASNAKPIVPVMIATPENKEMAIRLVRLDVVANGGTKISTWLNAAYEQFQTMPTAIRQALLLTDGQNDISDINDLQNSLQRCEGVFQCDCRGVGTDWQVKQLQSIADRLLGTTDIIAAPEQITSDFQMILGKALGKKVADVKLRLWSPQGANILYCKQVSPTIMDLTAQRVNPQTLDYPTGAWAAQESRDYHFCIQVTPGNIGDEMLAGRASLVATNAGVETKIAEGKILATWTDDDAKSTRIDRTVAHYTGQAELAQSIQEGLAARSAGNLEVATVKLERAVQLARESGNEATTKLLKSVVDIDEAGTVRLKRSIEKLDEMALETRSTVTTRIPKL
jgi:von Willebrand factor type A C-terminal domain/von Willebrand factor type A domain